VIHIFFSCGGFAVGEMATGAGGWYLKIMWWRVMCSEPSKLWPREYA
jgi:hypothetical protein